MRHCSRVKGKSSYTGMITLEAPDGVELKPLTDEELKHTIACYCERCGTELRIHPLFPLVGGKSLEHACVAKPPVLFTMTLIEQKPMDMPITKILDMPYEFNKEK